MNMNETNYRHVRLWNGAPMVTLAFKQQGKKLKVGIAYCSPRDQYCKDTGRLLAKQRMITQGKHAFTIIRSRSYSTNISKILGKILSDNTCPDFAQRTVIEDLHSTTY